MSKITYPEKFPAKLVEILDGLIGKNVRVKFVYPGWDEVGYLGNTMGPVKAPMLVKTRRSFGGSLISKRIPLRVVSSSKRDGTVYWDFEKMDPILFVMES